MPERSVVQAAGILLALACLGASAPSRPAGDWQALAEPRHGLEQRLLADARDGHLDEHPLVIAALIASGVASEANLAGWSARVEGWRSAVVQRVGRVGSEESRARGVLHFLHDEVLRGSYQATTSDLVRLLESGEHNCVGATVIYLTLAEAVGLRGSAIEWPGHVACLVQCDGDWRRIEPTSRDGWRGESFSERGGAGTRCTDASLVAMIYYNRAIDRLEARDYLGAARENILALAVDPRRTAAVANLLAAWNNGAIALAAQGEHRQAVDWLRRGLELAPTHRALRENLQRFERLP